MLGRGDNMEALSRTSTLSVEDSDIAEWLDLFDRLNIALESTGGPEARRIFRGLGPRRHAHAYLRLLRERQRLVVEIECLGVCSFEKRVGSAPASSFHESLHGDYVKLANAFVKCALLANQMEKISLTHWLLDRARMHQQQAKFLLT
jgi:hypothetical protein